MIPSTMTTTTAFVYVGPTTTTERGRRRRRGLSTTTASSTLFWEDIITPRRHVMTQLLQGKYHQQQQQRRHSDTTSLFASTFTESFGNDRSFEDEEEGIIPGLLSNREFDSCQQIDNTIRTLSIQLPLSLTKPLTATSAQKVFTDNVKLTVQLRDSDEITLLKNVEELISLSDVLVISTTAAQQANSLFSFGGGGTTVGGGGGGDSINNLECQIVLDRNQESLIIPWKATAPIFLGTLPSGNNINNNIMNRFEGLSEFVLNTENGRVEKHIIRKASWNGQSLEGPAIGQALRALQTTMTTLQKSPIFRGSTAIFLEQAAAAAAAATTTSSSSSLRDIEGTTGRNGNILVMDSIKNVTGWIQIDRKEKDTTNLMDDSSSPIPLPGTTDWKEYAMSHKTLVELRETVLPLLSSLQEEDTTKYFNVNVTLQDTRGNIILRGKQSLSNYFQSLALTRTSTGGSWTLQECKVLDWRRRQISIRYVATNNPLIITGQDIYTLSTSKPNSRGRNDDPYEFPVIQEIRQTELTVATTDGTMNLDGGWLMKNLASAVERSSSPTTIAPMIRSLFRDVVVQSTGGGGGIASGVSGTRNKKKYKSRGRQVSTTAARNTYFLMADLHERLPDLWNDEDIPLPASEYLADNVELKGYLGETLLRGSTTYLRTIGSFLSTTRQALNQPQQRSIFVLDSSSRPRIELTSKGNVRVSWTLTLRGGPGPITAPLSLELISDYVIDSDTGLVIEHRLVETRINGQLTPGDVLSRTVTNLLNLSGRKISLDSEEPSTTTSSSPRRNSEDFLFQTMSEAISWLRNLSS